VEPGPDRGGARRIADKKSAGRCPAL